MCSTSALSTARRSVKPQDVLVYEEFARNMRQISGSISRDMGRAQGTPSAPSAAAGAPPPSQFQNAGGEDDAMYD